MGGLSGEDGPGAEVGGQGGAAGHRDRLPSAFPFNGVHCTLRHLAEQLDHSGPLLGRRAPDTGLAEGLCKTGMAMSCPPPVGWKAGTARNGSARHAGRIRASLAQGDGHSSQGAAWKLRWGQLRGQDFLVERVWVPFWGGGGCRQTLLRVPTAGLSAQSCLPVSQPPRASCPGTVAPSGQR